MIASFQSTTHANPWNNSRHKITTNFILLIGSLINDESDLKTLITLLFKKRRHSRKFLRHHHERGVFPVYLARRAGQVLMAC